MSLAFQISASAVGTSLSYTFSGSNSADAGYAQGKITLSSDSKGVYYLYWANDTKALDGYYELAELDISDNDTAVVNMEYHTAIPKGATKLIAVRSKSDLTVENASAVFSIPYYKQLSNSQPLYTFNSYSDVHIDNKGYYKVADKNWKQALKFATDKNTDFIISSGDMITNEAGPDSEWDVYEKILAQSDYLNPVWEADGNHDMRSGVASGLKLFIKASGTDNTVANYDANKPYYYVTEKTTGDIFIFMALETGYSPAKSDEFSADQMKWLSNLLEKYYGKGVNIYIIEHSPINGFGAGDRMSNPYYKGHLKVQYQTWNSNGDYVAQAVVEKSSKLSEYNNTIFVCSSTYDGKLNAYA